MKISPLFHIYIRKHSSRHQIMVLFSAMLISLFTPISAMAEIVIGGNVYGGGNEGEVDNNTSVTVQQGTLQGNVYGGGNQGNLNGNANVELKGGTIQGDVFGGARMADISGRTYVHINGEEAVSALIVKAVYGGNDISGTIGTGGDVPFTASNTTINNTWNAFIRATKNNAYPIIIGSLYGGGNGAYEYIENGEGFKVTLGNATYTVNNIPTLNRAYLELNGGIYGSVYGGGNAATVTESTVIYANNSTAINGTLNRVPKTNATILGLYEGADYTTDGDNMVLNYHISRMFGGNNLAEMSIRPTWDLKQADINNLYSGGNRGDMTHPNGIAIAIQSDRVRVNNVYGGCRMADVNPSSISNEKETIYNYEFEPGYAARVYITGGKINNIYGGNDISGKVYYGTNVEIHGAISGDVYGAGNGSYAYTDNPNWVAAHPEDADLLYTEADGSKPVDGLRSAELLNKFRPHVEKTLVHVAGTESKRVVVAGGLFCGGSSATLAKDGELSDATATFKIGKYVDIQEVYLGSNGENLISDEILSKYADKDFSSLTLTNPNQFAEYMKGVAVAIQPNIAWDDALDYQTRIGSFFCGGNVGSMTYDGVAAMEFPKELVIFNKIVAGCNSANIAARTYYNAMYEGGLTGAADNDKTKVRMLVRSRLEPAILDITKNGLFVESSTYNLNIQPVKLEGTDGNAVDGEIYAGANVYGGCYNSGYINGDVEINIEDDLISPSVDKNILDATGNYVHASAMAIYGGGYGAATEIRGNTQINLSKNARVLLAFGGGQMGQVGNKLIPGNTEVNFAKDLVLPGVEKDNLNVYRAYAGGYAGDITGNTVLNLNGGGVLRGFGGACNADIMGTTTAIVGWRDEDGDEYNYGLPYVANAVFGGNDFGGQVYGDALREIKVKDYYGNIVNTLQVRSQSYVQYLSGNIDKALYGGSYGSYNYEEKEGIYNVNNEKDFKNPAFLKDVVADNENTIVANTFVHIDSKSRSEQDIVGSATYKDPTIITGIMGGGRGYRNLPRYVEVKNTYVLLNGTDYNLRNDATPMAYRVYGGGNLSLVHNTRVDAYSGTIKQIFGGTHGVKTENSKETVSYNVEGTLINYHESMIYPLADIFGAGANSGSEYTIINLYGGNVNNVHGGAYTEGYTGESLIKVPENSTIHANALFGGGLGEEEGRPCDVGKSTINYFSEDATVELGLFGGNNTARATKESHINVSVPVRNSNGILQSVYGAGYGEKTVAGFTHIYLQEGARVAKVYGGGKEGKVYNHYKYYFTGDEAVKNYYDNAYGHNANWATTTSQSNTFVQIQKGAVVEENAFGGGEGVTAYVNGQTHVELLGGLVKKDVYGAGDAGDMKRMTTEMNGYIADQENEQIIATRCNIQGGQVRKVFGGGLNGDIEGNTHVKIGTTAGTSYYDGVPAILRNVYGGSERGFVAGLATIDMNNGYIGYDYTNDYFPVLDFNEDPAVLEFEDEGNIYGGGYGEGAVVINTQVNLHGGIVRNSVYGGGEIAAIGVGVVSNNRTSANITTPGTTLIRMYGGLVEGDVFGGGRGYTYTYTYTGEDSPFKATRDNTDGYVFGETDVEIYRGTVGTDASVAKGHGNVFGGGNIGYIYSAGVKYTEETSGNKIKGHYYTSNSSAERTEDCCVLIKATEDDEVGITIRNAVFAGGNVGSGSDKVYANAVTVYGNATASVVDLYDRDLIKIGREYIGGLYGDGNLTFVDGYRELNITNYGTEYYTLQDSKSLTSDSYDALSAHKKEYYEAKEGGYQLREGRILNTIQRADFCGIFGSRVLLYGAQDRVPDEVDYTNYAINRVGEISLNQQNSRGNYLGLYNVVKFFGALTSDVDFNLNVEQYQEKAKDLKSLNRNKGTSHNVLAQASGTYLELVKELDANDKKVYGYVTGVIELDLIDMNLGEGGGYVYAKKEYGLQNTPGSKEHLTLSEANQGAVTSNYFTYNNPVEGAAMQTSGNFVHNERIILDEAYSADAHYWYVRGSIYNHDIIISAYAGGAQTFTNSVSIPLAINSSKMKLNAITTNIDNLEENEISNEKGYVLNFAMNNPTEWYKLEPIFKCTTDGIYGQREYVLNDLISETVFKNNVGGSAVFCPAYITTQEYSDGTKHLLKGSFIPKKDNEDLNPNYFEQAYICINTLKKDDKEYILLGELISATEYGNLNDKSQEHFQLAYVCTTGGMYGGKKFETNQAYPASDYINLSAVERQYFTYDKETAFDLLAEGYSETSLFHIEQPIASDPLPIIATAVLYVPRESDITKLSKDRTVTAEYEHTYQEAGDMWTETHNINIHIRFKSGQPVIGLLNTPSTVLPNSTIGLSVPSVTPGAYEVLSSGWEIYRNEGDANTHLNGVPYVNNATPMYWYQNGYYVAYYTKTYLGRTYSNPVPLSIANYHRMGEVMNHVVDGKHEYMYIDHEDAHKEGKSVPKIYIDAAEYESTSIAAGNGEKNDLDYFNDLYATTLEESKLDQRVRAGENLDIILRSDISPNAESWTSIASGDNPCFAGKLHGNGYTISGLNNSLFDKLCGKVYNLGVTGSFTGGGIADNGGEKGYAENCWVYTSATPTANAVIGQGGNTKNSYYRTDNRFKGGAIAKTRAAFEMGEVAYLLNGFYLDKRHTSRDNVQKEYNAVGYVEKYFADGDFRYANGIIPMSADERYSEENGQGRYTPIYPDDYIYFGQRITYAMTDKESSDKGLDLHNSFPMCIMKSENNSQVRIIRSHGNRVYRAPAYRQSKNIDKVYFNSYAHFVDYCDEQPIHYNVTAIDLTGHQDNNYTDAANGYRPYLDYEGIEHYTISGLTSNLLIYADPKKDASSYALLEKLYVPVLVYGKNEGNGYVNKYNELNVQLNLNQVHGHLVDLVVDNNGNRSYVAKRDQILVDKKDYNAPIAYTFDENCYMWHQRTPALYTEGNGGWESLCLPFEADMTTTQDKGQITHFYEGSTTNHEYWLRELNEVTTSDKTYALFQRPAAGTQSLVVKNTFLYDYYYSYNDDKDDNGDNYQDYYSQERTYDKYPNIKAYKPYIVAFPGKNYYEFDMSGQFVPEHTGDNIAQLAPQVVTFVSIKNATVAVTDDALKTQASTVNDYSYTGTLVNKARTDEYVLDTDGGSFQNESGNIVPFRAYMSVAANQAPRRIIIGNATEEEEPIEDIANRGLTIYGKKEAIYIESTLEYEATVTIYSLSGQVVSRVKVMPMSKEVVTVPSRGVYIANKKKVAVL